MSNTDREKVHYCSMRTATLGDIAEIYGNSQLKAHPPEREDEALLNEVRHLRWQDFELLSATHVKETCISIRDTGDVIAFFLPSEGQVKVSLRSRRILTSNGAIAVPRSHCREIKLEAGKRQIRLGIPSRRFHKHIRSIHGQALETSIKFEETPKLDPSMLDGLVGLIDTVFPDIENSPLSNALMANRIEALEICLMAVWPNNLWHNQIDSAACIAPRHVRSAIGKIRADPFTTISIPALAEACEVSVRTLQHGFRQFTTFSVSEFITHSRLSIIQGKAYDPEYIEAVRSRIGMSAFKRLNLEYRIKYGRNIGDR